jgi:hypothetical protein
MDKIKVARFVLRLIDLVHLFTLGCIVAIVLFIDYLFFLDQPGAFIFVHGIVVVIASIFGLDCAETWARRVVRGEA